MKNILQEMAENIQERVREVAYLMWESAGRHHGMAMEYWLAAEREVLSTMQTAAERMMPSEAKAGKPSAAPAAKSAPASPPAAAASSAAPAEAPVAEAVIAPAKPAARKAPASKAKAKTGE